MTLTDDELKNVLDDMVKAAGIAAWAYDNTDIVDNPGYSMSIEKIETIKATVLSAFAELREAVEYPPEWLLVEAAMSYVTCQWCHEVYRVKYPNMPDVEHKPDCLRQRALGISKGD